MKLSTIKVIDVLVGLASVVTIIGVPLVVSELINLPNQKTEKAIFDLNAIDLQLALGVNPQIRHAIEDGRPILQKNGGQFTGDQLGDYVDLVSTLLGDTYDTGLITEEALCSDQSYYIEQAYNDEEVKKYIKTSQSEDPTVYSGLLEKMARLVKYNKTHPC